MDLYLAVTITTRCDLQATVAHVHGHLGHLLHTTPPQPAGRRLAAVTEAAAWALAQGYRRLDIEGGPA